MIIAGFGFRAAADVDSLQQAFQLALCDDPIDGVATAADKAHTQSIIRFAERLDVPVIPIDADALTAVHTETRSAIVERSRAVGSVAEAAALAAAGPGATLLRSRVVSEDRMATCAIAQSSNEDQIA